MLPVNSAMDDPSLSGRKEKSSTSPEKQASRFLSPWISIEFERSGSRARCGSAKFLNHFVTRRLSFPVIGANTRNPLHWLGWDRCPCPESSDGGSLHSQTFSRNFATLQ